MSAESSTPFPFSETVHRIRLQLSDVVAVFALNQDSFRRHQDAVQELLHLDCALLEVERSSAVGILSTIKDKISETIEQSRGCFAGFLEKCKLDPIFGQILPEANYIEAFRSSINELRTDLVDTLLGIEIGPEPMEDPTFSNRPWPHPSSISSHVLEDEDTEENFCLAQLLTNELKFGNSQFPETVTNANQNNDTVASRGHNQYTENMKSLLELRTLNSAREKDFYQNVSTGPDGLYHCPWEGKDMPCNHQPTKQRSTYYTNVDAHLKPYHCKVEICRHAPFGRSYSLFRHEREAHRMHGVGDRFHLCPIRGCERRSPDHGFPRYWNLVDHMKRIHNCSPTAHSIDGCKESCKGGSFILQPELDDPTTESSITLGTPIPSGLRAEKNVEGRIAKTPTSRQSMKKPRKSKRVRKLR
ncbi:hypothetical protein L207DRAFT_575581 [Hyaloscypha variabilis F]|uniref:C2H2-type domain-containing protein n=1 Tax=Hyaloscypha variabilis (strain UAMH 11265 / GT02V1 / F) TaxID=1149755 RepID=A0A2J6SDU9_HYAVF|nr:hypothetical protein L207DRAFT_575581 [Hyaloscypha variabilis F]